MTTPDDAEPVADPAGERAAASPFASPSGRRELPVTPPGAAPGAPSGSTAPPTPAADPQHAPASHGSVPDGAVPHGSVPMFAPPSPYAPPTGPRSGDAPTSPYRPVAAQEPAWPGGPYAPLGTAGPHPVGEHQQPGHPDPAGQPHTVVVRRRRRRTLSVAWVAPLVALALVAGAVGGVLGARLTQDDHLADAGLPVAADGASTIERAPDSVAGIAAGVLPSVVSIQADSPEGSATGSGFVLRADGYLVTNNHVISQADGAAASTITITFVDGSEQPATVVGRTSDYDLAVLKVEVQGLTPLLLGDSDAVVVGDAVVAVGAPLGLAGTVTTGIVSALNRPVSAGEATDSNQQAFINAIQTDAAINPGNSGGPLVNALGQVIGINSAIAQPPGSTALVGGSIGLGFAIPSNQVRRTADQLIETGQATYPIIGVLLDQRYTGEGVQVSTDDQSGRSPVTADGPADRAGIHPGDVILAIDGRPVTDPDELIVAIRARTPGDTIVLHVRSGSRERDVRVKLDESPTE